MANGNGNGNGKMTEVDARRYLKSIKELREKRSRLYMQIGEIHTILTNCTVSYDHDRVSTSQNDKMANLATKIVEIEEKIDDLDAIIDERKSYVTRIAHNNMDERNGKYLIIRYVDGKGFSKTAAKMMLSKSTIKRIDKKAVLEFAGATEKDKSLQK